MICPAHLSELAASIFAAIAGMLAAEGRSSPHYAEHVGLLALRLEQIQRYNAVLEVEGDTFTSESAKKVGETIVVTKMVRARPEAAMLSDAMRQAQSLIGELMLNPSAALRIASGHKEEPGGFEGF